MRKIAIIFWFLFATILPFTASAGVDKTVTLTFALYHTFPLEGRDYLRDKIQAILKDVEDQINREVFDGQQFFQFEIAVQEYWIPDPGNYQNDEIFGTTELSKIAPQIARLVHDTEPNIYLIVFAGTFVHKDEQISGSSNRDKIALFNILDGRIPDSDLLKTVFHELGHYLKLRHVDEELCQKERFIMCSPSGRIIDPAYKKAWQNFYEKKTKKPN